MVSNLYTQCFEEILDFRISALNKRDLFIYFLTQLSKKANDTHAHKSFLQNLHQILFVKLFQFPISLLEVINVLIEQELCLGQYVTFGHSKTHKLAV